MPVISKIKMGVERWHDSLGVNVLAVDLLDSIVAETPSQASQALKKLKPERVENILQGLQKYIGPEASIATLGWSSGGVLFSTVCPTPWNTSLGMRGLLWATSRQGV